jgi:hypothetical protein
MPGGGAGAPGAGAGAPGRRPAGAFIISIVPLNFGAAAPLRLNPHFLQVVAASSFSVPQFGQNTRSTSLRGLMGPRAYSATLRFLKGGVVFIDPQTCPSAGSRRPTGSRPQRREPIRRRLPARIRGSGATNGLLGRRNGRNGSIEVARSFVARAFPSCAPRAAARVGLRGPSQPGS